MRKSQVDIISAIIIVVIATSLASSAYIWGYPLIKKRQDTAIVERAYTYFDPNNANSLPNIIEDIANRGGEKTFFVDMNGIWKLDTDKNFIEFSFSAKISNLAIDTQYPISLTRGASCTPEPSPQKATLGIDKSAVVCAQATTAGELVNIVYRVYFRELDDNPASPTKGFKITLLKDPAGLPSSTERQVKIYLSSSSSTTTLITKEIKILLI